jgi:hypothetical protein
MEGDASLSVGVTLALLASLLRESVNGRPALQFFAFKEYLEGDVLNAPICGGGDSLNASDIGNEICIQLSTYWASQGMSYVEQSCAFDDYGHIKQLPWLHSTGLAQPDVTCMVSL